MKNKYIQMAESRDDFNNIGEENFMTPTMGEMIQEDLMSEILEQYNDNDTDNKYKDTSILDTRFYTEDPFTTTPGHYPEEGAFVLKVNKEEFHINESTWLLNKFDGDTYSFPLDIINDGGQPVVMSKHGSEALVYKNFKEYFKKMGGSDSIQVRALGIDSAELPHYEIQVVPETSFKDRHKTLKFSEVLKLQDNNTTVLYEKNIIKNGEVHQRSADEEVELLLVQNSKGKKQYVEIITRDELNAENIYKNYDKAIKPGYKYITVLGQKDDSTSNKILDAYKAQAEAKKLLTESSDILLVLNANGIKADRNPIMTNKTFNSIYYFDDIVEYLIDEWNTYYGDLAVTNFSYIPYGMDNYKRSLGVVYVKYNGSWINLSKWILCNTEHTIANPSFDSSPELKNIGSGISDSFNLWSYDRNNIEWLDSFDKIGSKSYENRLELHKQLTGIDFLKIRDCALFIGDTLMLIPPESIRNITQTSYERLPSMRSKGTMAKNKGSNEHLLELSLYFYEEAGINGIPYNYTTPNGTILSYKMNGLRSLIAQFKIAPFLPIENGYINDVLGIEAVALMNMSIQNVEGFPRFYKVILTLKEFNYRVYMPEMPLDDFKDTDGIERLSKMPPMFAKCFNWDVFRYYYQRALMAGDDLARIEQDNNFGYGSYEYNLKFYTNKNTIGPWLLCGPLSTKGEISFYIPDEDWLNSALQVKKEKDNLLLTPESHVDLSPEAKAYMSGLSQLIMNIKNMKEGKDTEFNNSLENFIGKAISEDIKVNIKNPSSLDGLISSEETHGIDVKGSSWLQVKDKLSIVSNSKEKVLQNYILPIKNAFFESINDAKYITGIGINETAQKDINKTHYLSWDFCIKLNTNDISDDDWRDIREVLAKRVDIKIDEIFVDDSININFRMSFDKTQSLVISDGADKSPYSNTFVPTKSKDEEALLTLINHVGEDEELNPDEVVDEPINEYNKEVDFYVKDYKNPANMPFVPYVEGVLCRNFMTNISNTFTEVSIKAIEGRGPQYMGGQDTQLEFELITDDMGIVSALNTLPTLASAMAKKYRRILPAWPIKIHSDITRMLGVSEVLIDMMEVNTVEGFPGIYSITMRLTSVDRTQRQREALRRLDVAPQGGKVSYNYNSDLSIKNYFALDKALSQVELYPDLDLPSIKELGELGYRFVKYSSQERSYPDPDFYIVYNYPYTALAIKKMVKDCLSENLLNSEAEDESSHSFKFKDVMGAELTGKVEAYMGISLTSIDNKNAQNYVDILNNLEKQVNEKLKSVKGLTKEQKEDVVDKLELTAALKKLIMADMTDGWQIRPSWRAPLATGTVNKAIKESTTETPNVFADEIKARRQRAIKLIDEILSQPIEYRSASKEVTYPVNKDRDPLYKAECEKAVNDFLGTGKGAELISLLCPGVSVTKVGTELTDRFLKSYFDQPKPLAYIIGYLFASGCAISGDREYNSKTEKRDWYPSHFITNLDIPNRDMQKDSKYYNYKLPYCVSDRIEGSSKLITNIENGINNGSIFGAWKIAKYSSASLIANMMEKNTNEISYTDRKDDSVYNNLLQPGFLDPYYNKLNIDDEELERYKKSILLNIQSNAEAYLRIVLVTLRKMICDGLLISEIDIIAQDWNKLFGEELDIDGSTNGQAPPSSAGGSNGDLSSDSGAGNSYPANGGTNSTVFKQVLEELGFDTKELGKIMRSIKESAARSFCARLIYPFILTATEGNEEVYNLLKERDYQGLNSLTGYVEYGSGTSETKATVIKFLSALSGIKLTYERSSKKDANVSESQKLMNSLAKDVFIKSAEDPRAYLLHSFYDMLTNDKRGRLVRAFPTYYVVFIDEGRKMGSWKLHDNFYNMNSIASLNVVKSRKIASDTCTLVMNNMFNSYTMEPDSTTTQQYTDIYGLRDVFDSIFSPKSYFDKEKQIRLRKTIPDTVVLQPGIRLHVRIGYSADGSKLPIVFNGKVAEIDVAEVAQIVAQGDGHELTNPLNAFGEIEAVSLDAAQSSVTWFKDLRGSLAKGGESPRDLLAKVLTAKYGGWRKAADYISDGRWFNDNPFGIMHFGDPKYAHIFGQGEIVQNLYEVSDTALLKEMNEFANITNAKKTTPIINTNIVDKSFWDLLHLSANSGINYIGAIRDFGFRSTVFLGKPNHYYAYGYALIDNKVVEKRKPFQQFHYYDSYTDIVYNSIKASEAQMKTNAVGLWQSTNAWWGREQATVGPIYLDMNIYPEYQKSMTLDTGLLAAGNGGIDLNVTNHYSEKWSTDVNDDKVNKSLAWRVTANALRNSVKDMYQGDVCVLGDSSIKPHDRVYIHDVYEDMSGMFEVEAVVHNMSVETGFTTSIMPDVIARHEDSMESANQGLLSSVGAVLTAGVGTIILDKIWGASVHGKLTTVLAKSKDMYPAVKNTSKLARSLYNATGMKDFLDSKPTAKALFESFDILPDQRNIDLEAISKAIDSLVDVNKKDLATIETLVDVFRRYSLIEPDRIDDAMVKAYSNNKFGVSKVDVSEKELAEAIQEMRKSKKLLDKNMDVSKFNMVEFAEQIFELSHENMDLTDHFDSKTRRILEAWKAGKPYEGMGTLEQISKVMNEKELVSAVKRGDLKTTAVDEFFDGFKNIFKVDSTIDGKDITVFAKSAKLLKGGTLMDDLIVVFRGLLKANWVTLLIDIALEATLFIFTKNAQEVFTRFLQGIQAVDVYPLMKNNKPLVAGMNGHRGSVQGWPVREGYDSIQGMILNFMKTLDNIPLATWMVSQFVNPGVLESLSNEWRYDLGLEVSADMSEEQLAQALYGNISQNYAAHNKQGYALSTVPRITPDELMNKESKLLKYYQMVNLLPTAIPNNKQILELNYLLNEPFIRKAIADGRFEISHSKVGKQVINITFEWGSVSVPVYMNHEIVDMPLVREELIYVLNYVLAHDTLKDKKIYFKSGLRVNDKTGGWKSTGYGMILEINKSAGKELENVLNEFNETTKLLPNSPGMIQFNRNGDKIIIFALAPLVSI